MRVFVLDSDKNPLMPCHPARARELLKKEKAAVYRLNPFTVILKSSESKTIQPIQLKVDTGSRVTGLALVGDFKNGKQVIWAANLQHKGHLVAERLKSRRAIRRGRRGRKCRYRPARFLNRAIPKGWIPPSSRSRLDNIKNWYTKLSKFVSIDSISIENVKFDTQKMINPEVSGVEYQQGELFGYEVREYLLEKWGRKCAYCGANNIPLQVEHIIPKSRGGTDRVSNLTLSCNKCNQEKGTKTAEEFGHPNIQKQAKASLKDTAAVNTIRWKIYEFFKDTGLSVESGSGGRTKYNRTKQGYEKIHWIDAACVGKSGEEVLIPDGFNCYEIKAMGRGNRQMCRVDKYGFPRSKPKSIKRFHGFQTGDFVKAVVPRGKFKGTHTGRISGVRKTGSFMVGTKDGINYKYLTLLQYSDGYNYYISIGNGA